MVAWVPDRSGRFGRRPHFSREELDRECEAIVGSFLRGRYGEARYPISTDDLTVLVERHTSSLDLYADLSAHGEDVEGMTEFFPDELPAVAVSERLSSDPRRENRLRTTLAHELGHALFHRALWAERFSRGGLFERAGPDAKAICKRDTILEAREVDWMEWQAGYASGAILMPRSALARLVAELCVPRGVHAAVHVESPLGEEMVGRVVEAFRVSTDAARVRLFKLDFLTAARPAPTLFG
jgi:Zn-dependent peptidase ImmA (M78 family)